MKKYINIAFVYAIAAIACGVFYREFQSLTGLQEKRPLLSLICTFLCWEHFCF